MDRDCLSILWVWHNGTNSTLPSNHRDSIEGPNATAAVRSAVMPWRIDTPHVVAFVTGSQVTNAEARAAAVHMERQGSAFEVAETVAFLSFDAAG